MGLLYSIAGHFMKIIGKKIDMDKKALLKHEKKLTLQVAEKKSLIKKVSLRTTECIIAASLGNSDDSIKVDLVFLQNLGHCLTEVRWTLWSSGVNVDIVYAVTILVECTEVANQISHVVCGQNKGSLLHSARHVRQSSIAISVVNFSRSNCGTTIRCFVFLTAQVYVKQTTSHVAEIERPAGSITANG